MSVRIITGDAAEQLRLLPADSVHCVVTSPPYYGLRDYGVPGQLGMEASPAAYVEALVAVFREVRRVLRPDGTLWLNLGDSYAANRTYQVTPTKWAALDFGQAGAAKVPLGCKPKDLLGIPWMVAFALRADGWWLRQDIIWAKPNPMPESVTDRCTKAHEYLFLLSKGARYWFDADAIAEPFAMVPYTGSSANGAILNGDRNDRGRTIGMTTDARNRRSVWTVASEPFPEAHFATYPPALIEPCILAGTSEKGVCAKCGAPWTREVELGELVSSGPNALANKPRSSRSGALNLGELPRDGYGDLPRRERRHLGWQASCACNAAVVPATILDPFAGAGTTGLVADRLGRNAILIELNPEYAQMAERRLYGDCPLFCDVAIDRPYLEAAQ